MQNEASFSIWKSAHTRYVPFFCQTTTTVFNWSVCSVGFMIPCSTSFLISDVTISSCYENLAFCTGQILLLMYSDLGCHRFVSFVLNLFLYKNSSVLPHTYYLLAPILFGTKDYNVQSTHVVVDEDIRSSFHHRKLACLQPTHPIHSCRWRP